MTADLWAVLPAGIDDPAAPSGGNRYDRVVLNLLGSERDVHEIAVAGSWIEAERTSRTTPTISASGVARPMRRPSASCPGK